MATLGADISSTDHLIRVSGANLSEPRLRFRLDDELLDLFGWDRKPLSGGYRDAGLDTTRWLVTRGVEGTTPASHSAGATLMAVSSALVSSDDLTPPDPFPDVASIASINFIIDGNGEAITTGLKGFVVMPFAATITGADVLADQSGDLVVDIWKDTRANHPPTDADSITAAAPPTLDGEATSTDDDLTGWNVDLAMGDVLAFNVDSAATVTLATVILRLEQA